jgi:hypothetical protein
MPADLSIVPSDQDGFHVCEVENSADGQLSRTRMKVVLEYQISRSDTLDPVRGESYIMLSPA